MSHTPGPWEIGDVQWMTNQRTHVGYSYRPITAGSWEVATVWEDACDKEMTANVRLIAAAPELLAVVRMAFDYAQYTKARFTEDFDFGDEESYDNLCDACEKAIAKAEGR